MTKLSGFAAGLLFFVACGGGGDEGASAVDVAREAGKDACRRYLDCVLEAAPEAVAALLPSYGPDGECWASDDIEVLDICTTACIKSREGYTALFEDIAACGECQDDNHCAEAAGRPRCDPQSHACVACLYRSDCSEGSCNTETHACVECTANADCEGGACLKDTNLCVECVEKADCDGGACLTASNQCVECLVDTDCESGVCDVDKMICGECKFKVQCPGGACDYETNTCVDCLGDPDCDAGQTCVNKSCV
ncbi:MAG: hypothetical protein H0T76_22930 [Nannocystis sp.]|nr:hypothetical protein [Nannocystis sp.]MBA3549338.1 hypothetical protein [Nannocystis sp.]